MDNRNTFGVKIMEKLQYILINQGGDSKYRKKVCGDRIPIMTYDSHDETYTLDLSTMKTEFSQQGLCELEQILGQQSDQAIFLPSSVRIHIVPEKLSEIHKTTLRILQSSGVLSDNKKEEEMQRNLTSEKLWDYWQMLQNYAEFRSEFQYYKAAFEIATTLYGKSKGSVLDVGTKDVTVTLDMFPDNFYKVAMDNNFPKKFVPPPTINLAEGNLYEISFNTPFGIVLCQQVLEHLPNPKEAFQKLAGFCKDTLVISVPYGSWHKTPWDPINQDRVLEWTSGRVPNIEKIVEDFGVERYIAGYKLGK